MPADFEVLSDARTVLTRAWGSLTDEDLFRHMAAMAALFRSGVLDTSWAQICDFTAVDDLSAVTTGGIRRMAEGNPWPGTCVRAFIVDTDEQFGLARMYQAIGDPKTGDLCITRSAADAALYIARQRAGSRPA